MENFGVLFFCIHIFRKSYFAYLTNYLDILAYLKTLISVMSVSFTDTRCIFPFVNFWGIYFARIFSGFVNIYTSYILHTYILVYIQLLIKS